MMSKASKIVVDKLIFDLQERPRDFCCDEHVLKDKVNCVEYWVANTIFNGGIWRPYKMSFGMFQSFRFHSALDKWKAWTNVNSSTINQ